MVVIPDEIQFETMKLFVQDQCNNGLNVELLDKKDREKGPALAETIEGATYCPSVGR